MMDEHRGEGSVVVEREFRCRPDLLWRALTEPHLIAEWLMQNDFLPQMGHRFSLTADLGSVSCEVQIVEPNERLSYRWDTKDLHSVVTWTLAPTTAGTLLRMEQVGFQPQQTAYHRGAMAGWPRFLDALEKVVARIAAGSSEQGEGQ